MPSADINMCSVYENLPFDNKNGGAWKQGFHIESSNEDWVGRKLKGVLSEILHPRALRKTSSMLLADNCAFPNGTTRKLAGLFSTLPL